MNNITLTKNLEGLGIRELLGSHQLICLVCRQQDSLENVANNIKFFCNNTSVQIFPEWDCLPYDRVSPSQAIMNQRLGVLNLLREPIGRVVIVTSLKAIFQKVIAKDTLHNLQLKISKGNNISREILQEFLAETGFVRLINAVHAGEYAARGSIMDIVADDSGWGYRLDFLGDKIESIRKFNVGTQISAGHLDGFEIHPSSEILFSPKSIEVFRCKYIARFGVQSDPLFDSITNGRKYSGMENWLPLFYDHLSEFSEYLPQGSLTLMPEGLEIEIEEINNKIQEQYESRKINFKGQSNAAYKPLEPSELYLAEKNLLKFEAQHYALLSYSSIGNLVAEAAFKKISVFELLGDKVAQDSANYHILSCYTNGSRERLSKYFKEHEVNLLIAHSFDEVLSIGKGKLIAVVMPLDNGFKHQGFIFYSEQDVVGERFTKRGRSKKVSAQIFNEINTLAEGELIVHSEHGIGRFSGLETIKVGNTVHDFAKLIYADGDKLFLPVENLEMLTRFGGEDAQLDKLGGVSWQSRKARIKNKIKIAAENLLKIAAARELNYSEPAVVLSDLYEKFCGRFPYVETEDQLAAIEDVSQDLLGDKPMDRLICGDVGFGKTEVALRAAFQMVASQNNSQVAVLVPTTLLARQHYKTFTERFQGFPFRIAQLSRFTPPKEVKKIKEDITQGNVDIIIGTHALLAKDIKFSNLGMIIIDEEQHFGVGQKEKLKELKSNCHVLTLSATPIPRTLQMSLSGIRELSLLATPPLERLPIRTYVLAFDGLAIREAILREINRGGRVFFVTPRVAYIDSLVSLLKEIVPEAKVVFAHGKLSASKLDTIMNSFYDGKFDVLVSTTIVESGLDIPMANTLIIDRSHMFGLSQLYQIRGRVGRGNSQAYAYLTYPTGMRLNPVSEKRLSILHSLDSLGVGFSIASHDMDMRGYGNLVGEEQSGHIREVGIELYQQMLKDAVLALKDKKEEMEDWSPVLNIGLSVQIPESYVPDISLRLSLYRRIAMLVSEEELEKLATEMVDRFGRLPAEAEGLLSVVKLKSLAKMANIEKIELGEKAVLVSFRNSSPKEPDRIVKFLQQSLGKAKLRVDGKLLIMVAWSSPDEIIKGLQKILQNIS